MSALLEQKCPNCGGAVEFNAGTQTLKCPYCDTEFDIAAMEQAAQKVANAGQDNFNWNSQSAQWQPDEISGMGVYTCKSCGGEIVADATTGATKCPYCDNPVVMTNQFEGGLKPNLIIPFKYDKKAAKEALNKYIASKKMVPKIFKDQNHIDEIKGVYVPHWLFTGTAVADADFKAERVRTWSDSNNNYRETSFFDCYRSGTMDFYNIPVDGSSKMDDTLMESIEPFDISEAVDFQTAYLAGYFADKYDVTDKDSIERANARIKKSTEDTFRGTVQGGYASLVTESSSVKLANSRAKYALFPVWLLNTSWNGNKYPFAMNGQTGKMTGTFPICPKKSLAWFAGVSAAVAALVTVIQLLVL